MGGQKVGFLGIGKKKEKNDTELDVPPIPPPGMEQKEFPDMPPSQEEFPSLGDASPNQKVEPLPALNNTPESKDMTTDLPPPPIEPSNQAIPPMENDFNIHKQIPQADVIPPIGAIPEPQVNIPSQPKPKESIPSQPPVQNIPPKENIPKQEVKREDIQVESKYMNIDKFKTTIEDIETIKSSLKDFEKELELLGTEEKEEDGFYAKLKSTLNTINKNLKSMDKIIFEG